MELSALLNYSRDKGVCSVVSVKAFQLTAGMQWQCHWLQHIQESSIDYLSDEGRHEYSQPRPGENRNAAFYGP